jgi:hypothetical protein
LKANHPGISFTTVSRQLGNDWKALSQNEKKPWLVKQKNAKAAYDKEYATYLKTIPKEKTKAYLDAQKNKALKTLQTEYANKVAAEDFPKRIKAVDETIEKVKSEIVAIEKASTEKAIEFFNKTRISPHVLSLITPYMPTHVNSKKLLVASVPDTSSRKVLAEAKAKLIELLKKQEEARKIQLAKTQAARANNNNMKYKVGEKVHVLFTVDGKDDYYEGKVQKITNQRKKLYTVVFDKNEVYTDIKEEEMKPLNHNGEAVVETVEKKELTLLDAILKPSTPAPKLTPSPVVRTASSYSIPVPTDYHNKYNCINLALLEKEGEDNVIFLEPGRIQIDESSLYEDEADPDVGVKIKKNTSIIGLGPERSYLACMEGDFENLFDYIEEGALIEIFEGVTARFENIKIDLSEMKGQKSVVTFGLRAGSTAHFINCEFINCTINTCLLPQPDGHSGDCKIYVKNCIFTEQAVSTFEMESEGNELIIENSLFCNNGVHVENSFSCFRDVSSLISIHEREKLKPKVGARERLLPETVIENEEKIPARLHSVILIGCRFISNRNHIVHFDENVDTPLGWMERMMGNKKKTINGPALTLKKSEHLKLKFENNWTFDNMCSNCSMGNVCPEQTNGKDESSDSSLSERSKFFRLMRTMRHGALNNPFDRERGDHDSSSSDSSDDSSIIGMDWRGHFGGIRLDEDGGDEGSFSY